MANTLIERLEAAEHKLRMVVAHATGGSDQDHGAGQKPLAIDLFCGLGGWTDGLLAEGYRVLGFDIEAHEYGDERYPAELILADVLETPSPATRVPRT